MYAAKGGALDIHWTDSILDETTRNLIAKFGFTAEDAAVLVERVDLYLPRALIETRKRDEAAVARVEMDDKDRHVLAAVLSAKADVLLTDKDEVLATLERIIGTTAADAVRAVVAAR